MRVLVLRQEKSILVVFDRRPQLIGLSVRADVLNSAKKRMDSFPGLFISQTEETEQKRERVDVSRDAMKTSSVVVVVVVVSKQQQQHNSKRGENSFRKQISSRRKREREREE